MLTRTCTVCGMEFEKEDVPKEYLYDRNLCSRGCSNQYIKEYREERKKSGKCTDCGEPALEDSIRCQDCLDKQKRLNERYKREGKCPKCGDPSAQGRVLCENCLEKDAKRHQKKAEQYKEEGKCVTCGEPARGDSIYCQECLEKDRKKYQRRKEEGKCTDCGKELSLHWNNVLCPECLEKDRNYEFYGEYATDAEIRNGLHTDMVENKLDV